MKEYSLKYLIFSPSKQGYWDEKQKSWRSYLYATNYHSKSEAEDAAPNDEPFMITKEKKKLNTKSSTYNVYRAMFEDGADA